MDEARRIATNIAAADASSHKPEAVKSWTLENARLFWAAWALAVASFAYGTYVLMAPATADLPSWLVALGFYAACLLSVLMAFLARKN